MKTLLIIYRIISFILIPVAFLLALITFIALFAAIGNPQFLFGVFMLACVVIYSFTSLVFLIKGIQNTKPCKHSLRDWIRVNAFVSLLFAITSLFSSIEYLSNAVLRNQVIEQTIKMQSSMPPGITKDFFNQFILGTLYFLLVYSALLIAHIFMSFILLKRYKNLFNETQIT